jgi:hypothetical protein
MSNPEVMTPAEFAALAGYKQSYVRQLRKEGRLVMDDAGRVLVADSLALIAATRDPSKAGVVERHAASRAAKTAAPASDDTDLAEDDETVADTGVYGSHAQRRAKALADKEEELAAKARRERLIEEGALLQRDQVEPAVSLAFGQLRQALESTARELAPELAAIDDEDRVAATLTDRFERLLGNLSRALSALAQRSAA